MEYLITMQFITTICYYLPPAAVVALYVVCRLMGLITVTRFNKGHKWDLKTNSPCPVLTSGAERRGEGRGEEGEDGEGRRRHGERKRKTRKVKRRVEGRDGNRGRTLRGWRHRKDLAQNVLGIRAKGEM